MSYRPTVLITGANQGLGFQAAKLLAEDNKHTVILTSRDLGKGEAARKAIIDEVAADPEHIHVVQLDVTDDDSLLQAAEQVNVKFGGQLDVLVNNAGKTGIPDGPISEHRKMWNDIFALNVFAPDVVTKVFAPMLKKSTYEKRRVIFVSSSVGSIGLTVDPKSITPYAQAPYPIYKTSKAALNMLAECWRWGEFKDTGIATVVACPGFCRTNFAGGIGYMTPEEGGQVLFKRVVNGSNEEVDGVWFLPDDSVSPW